MPKQSPVIDDIIEDAQRSVISQAIRLKCCIVKCRERPTAQVSMAFSDGRRDIFMVCEKHLAVSREVVPGLNVEIDAQGIFFYGRGRWI